MQSDNTPAPQEVPDQISPAATTDPIQLTAGTFARIHAIQRLRPGDSEHTIATVAMNLSLRVFACAKIPGVLDPIGQEDQLINIGLDIISAIIENNDPATLAPLQTLFEEVFAATTGGI